MSKWGSSFFEAMEKGELRVTNDLVCPYCKAMGVEKPPPNAHRAHKWANKRWLDNYMKKVSK